MILASTDQFVDTLSTW